MGYGNLWRRVLGGAGALALALGGVTLVGQSAGAAGGSAPQRGPDRVVRAAAVGRGAPTARAATAIPVRVPRRQGPASTGRLAPGATSAAGSTAATGAKAAVESNQSGLGANLFTPSDSTGAIGPSHYIEMVNADVGVFDRGLDALREAEGLGPFIGAAAGNLPTDPQVQWDPQAGRWLFAALEVNPSGGTNFLHFGWSTNGDPPTGQVLTSFCSFSISTGAQVDDFPKLGHDANFLLIGVNVFATISSNAPLTSTVWAIPKPAQGDTSCAAPTAFAFGSGNNPLTYSGTNDLVFTPVPANVADSSSTAYILSLDFFTPTSPTVSIMGVFHVSPASGCTPSTAPCLVSDGNLSVNPWANPSGDWTVSQPNGVPPVDALLGQLTQAVQVFDPTTGTEAVWTQHTNGVTSATNARTVVTWYEILPTLCSGGTCAASARHQEGVVADPNLSVFNGAISPDSRGENAVIDYNTGGANSRIALALQDRNASSPLNAMFGPQTLAISGVPQDDFSCFLQAGEPCRWGDYPGASPDPVVRDAVWGTSMLAGSVDAAGGDPTWTTRNFFARRWEPVPLTLAGATGPDVASWGTGRLDVFGEGTGGDLQHTWAPAAGVGSVAWSGPESLGGVLTAEPGAVSWGVNRIDVFVRGTDGAMYHKWWDGRVWNGFESLGGVLAAGTGPDAASWTTNRLDVFVRGTDGALYHKWFDGLTWNGWESLGGVLTSAPTAVSWTVNRLDVFVRGTDGAMYHKWWDGQAWNGFERLGGSIAAGTAPEAASCGPNLLDVVAMNASGVVIRDTWNGAAWSGFQLVGGPAATGDAGAVCRAGLGLNILTEAAGGAVSRASIG